MKKILALALVFITCLALVACAGIGGNSNSQVTPPTESPRVPIVRDGMVTVFGAKVGFDIVYPTGSDDAKAIADSISEIATGRNLSAPVIVDDSSKTEGQCELLVGDTNRALSREAKALVLSKPATLSRDAWALIYKNGQLAIYAINETAYESAIEELCRKYYSAGAIRVPIDAWIDGGSVTHDPYMSYDSFDNFYDGYLDPFGISEKDYKQMVVTRDLEGRYRISYTDEVGGTFSSVFIQKDWGMWAMGAMTYVTANGETHTMTYSSTDYEFVLQVGAKTQPSFRSGNHGDYPGDDDWEYYVDDTSKSNDKLLDMTFYDGKSGEKIELSVGETKTLDGLRIVMHHNVYEMNYTEENVLINTERSYLYNGYDVMLDTKLYAAQDVKFGNSYSCMLPVSKAYGNCAMLYTEDGSSVYMKTPLSDAVTKKTSGVRATLIDIWGENNPQYHLIVKLNTPEDQLKNPALGKNQGYVGLHCKVGSGRNKLYCSFNGGAEASEKKGTTLHFNSSWSFSLQEDFGTPTREPDFWVGAPKQ